MVLMCVERSVHACVLKILVSFVQLFAQSGLGVL